MSDHFQNHVSGLEAPATAAEAISPDDSADLPTIPRALYATGAGEVTVTMINGNTVTLPILAGTPLPVRVSRVWASGTTATGIVGVW
jgi:hypothetical protein